MSLMAIHAALLPPKLVGARLGMEKEARHCSLLQVKPVFVATLTLQTPMGMRPVCCFLFEGT